MGASIARKRTRLGCRVLRHKLVPFLALWPVFHARRWSFDTRSVLVHFLPNMCLCVASEVTLLEIPPCQTSMCGVAYSCSYVLLKKPICVISWWVVSFVSYCTQPGLAIISVGVLMTETISHQLYCNQHLSELSPVWNMHKRREKEKGEVEEKDRGLERERECARARACVCVCVCVCVCAR